MAQIKLGVGEPCPTCQTPAIPGKSGGAYCLPCYKEWAAVNKPQGGKPAQSKENVNWDKIAEGKVRTLFALEQFKLGKPLDVLTASAINKWVAYCMTGKLAGAVPSQEPTITEEYPVLDVPFQ